MHNSVLCPLDGRYRQNMEPLINYMGDRAFAARRLEAECIWLETLSSLRLPGFKMLTAKEKQLLRKVCDITEPDFAILQALETKGYGAFPATKHDVKAAEYFLRLRLQKTPLKDRLQWIHFALTSEDINSAAYACLLSDGTEKVLLPSLLRLEKKLNQLARKEARSVMLARTHGQPAVPTTFGKEVRVFACRLHRQIEQLKAQQISCKFGGAVGNYNAHLAAFPQVNWLRATQQFVRRLNQGRRIKIILTPVSTQVDPRDTYAELFDTLRRIHVILIDFCQDMWHYGSAGFIRQQVKAGEVGSSTMPQKVNPIQFENAEGNLQLADALFNLFSHKLPISRLQRDLSDSTVLRNMGMAFGYALQAYRSVAEGLDKFSFDRVAARAELSAHPEMLAEAVQTVLRAAGYARAYEDVRDFTRGKKIGSDDWKRFADSLNINQATKEKLHRLTAEAYVGAAPKLAEGKND